MKTIAEKTQLILMSLMFMILLSCSSHDLNDYAQESPRINLREFFDGKIKALGIVQNRSGKVIKRFEVDIIASWKGDEGVLDEKFHYSDNTKSTRVWNLKEINPNQYEARAHDVIGVAKGGVSGNAFFLEYYLDLPVGNTSYKIHFEDWMYLVDSKTILARTYMTKWGFNVGEITIVMKKE